MFIYMVINDALQLSLVTALYVVSYIFRKIHASFCCFLVSPHHNKCIPISVKTLSCGIVSGY